MLSTSRVLAHPVAADSSGPSLRPMRRLLAFVALAALAAGTGAHAASAPPDPGRGINVSPDPASARKSKAGTIAELGTVQPGTPLRDGVLVRSSLDQPTDVLLYAADAQPAVGGGFGFSARTDPQNQVGKWLRLQQDRVTVRPDGRVVVPYTLTVPPGTPGGEYVGAVVAEPVQEGSGAGVQARTRFAMAVYLRVPGGAAGSTPGRGRIDGTVVLEALDPRFEGNRACPVVRYRNDSQDVIDPVVTVTTTGALGGSTYRRERLGALLPDTSAEVALPCVDRPLGQGRLQVELSSPKGGGAEATPYTWLPWPFFVSLLLLLLLVAALLTTFFRGMLGGKKHQVDGAAPNAQATSPS